MARPDDLSLADVLVAIATVERFLTGLDRQRFLDSQMVQHAVLFN